MLFPPSPWVVLKKNLQTFCSCYHQKKLKTLWWCCEFNDFFCKLTKMKLMPTLISTLETSKLSHTVCCSMHHCSPAVLFCCKCWDEQLNRPGPGLSPARRRALLCIHMLASFMMMNGASRSRALKNQEHWYCTPAMAHSVLAASSITAATEPCTRYHHHCCSHSEVQYLPVQTVGHS